MKVNQRTYSIDNYVFKGIVYEKNNDMYCL